MEIRRHIFFFGRVQGVGFRNTCVTVAKNYAVTGWVKNIPDGSVEMVVEGTIIEVRRYIAEVCDSTYGRIDDKQFHDREASGEFKSMVMRH